MTTPDLILDPSLKYWVLLPITFVMVMVGVLRQYASVLLQASPKLQEWRKIREQLHLQKAAQFRAHGNLVLTKAQFEQKQAFLILTFKSLQYLAVPLSKDKEPVNPLNDPNVSDSMYAMLKSNVANYIPQTVIMWWVNFFFAGFVIMKLPFPLTLRFKSMLQSGVSTPDLDVRWVSSISWYFVNLLGLRPVYTLILGENTVTQQMMNNQPVLSGMPGGPSPDKLFEAELENIQILSYNGAAVFDGIERRLILHYQ